MKQEKSSILIINSEPFWLQFCQQTLQENGYSVYAQSSLGEAMTLLESPRADEIVLILLDNNLIKGNEKLISQIKKVDKGQSRSVIVLFAIEPDYQATREAYKQGASDCVGKPYDENALIALIEQLLASHRVENPTRPVKMQKNSKVLVVEDDQDWLETLVNHLPQENSIAVEQATNLEMAREKIQQHSFDLIISDLRLDDADEQNYDGLQFIQEIRNLDGQEGHQTSIIIVSAFGKPEHVRESYSRYGVHYFFDKKYLSPIKYRELTTAALTEV